MFVKLLGIYINPNQITYMEPNGSSTMIHFAVTQFSGDSQFSPGGSGSGRINSHMDYIMISMQIDTVMEAINKEIALVHALEDAARKAV